MSYFEYAFEDLIEAWNKLQEAHLDFEQTPEDEREYSRRYDALLNALEEYQQAVARLRPRRQGQERKETGGS